MNLEGEEPESVVDTTVDSVVAQSGGEPPVSDEPIAGGDDPSQSAPISEEPAVKRKGPSDSLIGELTAQRARRRDAEARAERLDRELSDAKALIERFASKDPNAQTSPRLPSPTFQPQDDDTRIKAAVAKARYDEKTEAIYAKGHGDFGTAEFNEATNQFAGTVGDGVVPLVSDIMDVAGENAHKVIYELSADPARAIAIRDMSPTRRAIAIHKMVEMTEAPVAAKTALSPAPTKVSKAPAPAPQIQVTAKTEKIRDWANSDKMSEDEFSAWWKDKQKDRRGMHR